MATLGRNPARVRVVVFARLAMSGRRLDENWELCLIVRNYGIS